MFPRCQTDASCWQETSVSPHKDISLTASVSSQNGRWFSPRANDLIKPKEKAIVSFSAWPGKSHFIFPHIPVVSQVSFTAWERITHPRARTSESEYQQRPSWRLARATYMGVSCVVGGNRIGGGDTQSWPSPGPMWRSVLSQRT